MIWVLPVGILVLYIGSRLLLHSHDLVFMKTGYDVFFLGWGWAQAILAYRRDKRKKDQ